MKIKALTIETNDLQGTAAFYKGLLGLTLVDQNLSSITFNVGFTDLTFLKTDKTHPFYHFAFSIPTNKVDEAYSFIAERTTILPYTAESTIANFANWNAHAFYFHDNQGNIVEFIAHHDLQNAIYQPFDSKAILSVCEIGIPVEDVTAACEAIYKEHGVPYYIKGPRLNNFCVMGDELGLFIVTKIGRGWIPTQEPSQRFSTQIEFEHEGKVFQYETKA